MEKGLLGGVKWEFSEDVLTFTPKNGNEGTFVTENKPLHKITGNILLVRHIKTNGVLHCEGDVLKDMFCNYHKLETADLSAFETSKATSMDGIFNDCCSLVSLNLSSFDTSNVQDMSYMFRGCKSLKTLDLSNFDTSKVQNAIRMFYKCDNLERIDFSRFTPKHIENYDLGLFACGSLKDIIISDELKERYKIISPLFSCDTEMGRFVKKKVVFVNLLTKIEKLTGCDLAKEREIFSSVTPSDWNEIFAYKRFQGVVPDERLSNIIKIIKHDINSQYLTNNEIQYATKNLEACGIVSDIQAYLSGVPVEDILA